MRQGGIGAAEAEMCGDLAEGGGEPFGVLLAPDKPQNLLLSFRKLCHTEQMSSTRPRLSRGYRMGMLVPGKRCLIGCRHPPYSGFGAQYEAGVYSGRKERRFGFQKLEKS